MTEPIQFGAPAQAPAPAPEAEQPVQQPTPEVEQIVEDAQGAEHDVEQLAPEAEQAAEEFAHTHQSVLTDLMGKLEGIVHLGKSEIVALVAEARGLFEKL